MSEQTIYQALVAHHNVQRELCTRLLQKQVDGPQRLAVMQELKLELAAHAGAEEREFYVPCMRFDEGLDISRHAIAEHHELDELVETLEAIKPENEAEWLKAAQELVDEVLHHVGEEEEKFFQRSGELLSSEQKIELAKLYQQQYEHLKTNPPA